MQLDARGFGIAAGTTAAALSAVCWAVIAVAPRAATQLFGMMIHVDLGNLLRAATVPSFVVGVVCWGVGTGLVFGFGAWVYNRMQIT
ncbi:MAG: hypothetical protein EXR93_09335 [Gemmatimonadetes bacterium]|nr:hypothetical protein [Gemmatimonadota bacterium]